MNIELSGTDTVGASGDNYCVKTDSNVQDCSWFDCNRFESCSSTDTDSEHFDDNML